MIEAHFGGSGPAPAQPPGRGDDTTGPGAAPGVGAPSSPPRTSGPDTIRAILAGISSPAPRAPTLTVVRPAEEAPPAAGPEVRPEDPAAWPGPPEDPGGLTLASVDVVLPHIVESARAAGRPLTVVVARPGPAATPGVRLAPASPGAVADLAAALAVSLDPEQDLLSDGPGHLVVTTLGGAGRRDTVALMQRAAEAGAPMFTWAAARFPRDAQSAGALLDLARARVDGTEPVAERRSVAAVVWAGAAAALLVAAFAFIAHGHGAPRASGTAGGHGATGATHTGALSGTGGTGGSFSGGSVSGGSGSSASGSRATGTGGSGSVGGGGTGSSGTGSGVAGTGTSAGNTGGTGSSGTGGGSTATTTLSGSGGNTTATTTGNTTATTTGSTTGTTTVNSTSPTTTTTVCSYNLLGQLICTVNGLLGGH